MYLCRNWGSEGGREREREEKSRLVMALERN